MYRERIRESYDRLSKSQKRIADFLMTSHRDAAFMTASRLAIVLDVDVATITRFAQRLEYPGYPELLEEVRATVQEEMSAGFRPVTGVSEAGRLFVRALTIERENLERTLANISIDAVEQAVEALANARTIYVGQHTSELLAQKFSVRLDMLGFDVKTVGGDGVSMSLVIRNIDARDVVVGFGFSGYANNVAAVLRIVRERGAKTIGISGSDVSMVARIVDIPLICSATSPMHLPSEVAAGAVIEGLTQALAEHRMETYNESVQALGATFEMLTDFRGHPIGSIDESIMKLY
jgi:DNA-binding MurR/RpiR family transcriptional regulator